MPDADQGEHVRCILTSTGIATGVLSDGTIASCVTRPFAALGAVWGMQLTAITSQGVKARDKRHFSPLPVIM